MSVFLSDKFGEVEAILDELAQRVAAAIARDGAYRVRTAGGCFVCRGLR
jgi:hypothetical protein